MKILILNNISSKGLSRFPDDDYVVSENEKDPDAIIVRSHKMHGMEFTSDLKAVARAGTGVNNIPVKELSEKGVVVFNTPGANANAVKELVLAGMLLACRNICQAWGYTNQLQGDDQALTKDVEAGKKQYAGYELPGRTLGVVGLGAIGILVANAARSMGMNVIGYDPNITVEGAWKLSSDVKQAVSINELLQQSDFVTFHVPLLDSTRHMINADSLKNMKDGVVILNFARGEIVHDVAICEAIEAGKVHAYVCDFPSNSLKNHDRVIALPHLGASTKEAEENCAVMAVDQVKDFLEHGNIKNSINFPDVSLPRAGVQRLSITNENIPDMLGQISHILGENKVNIVHMINESKGDYAYTLVDLGSILDDKVIGKLKSVSGVLIVRTI